MTQKKDNSGNADPDNKKKDTDPQEHMKGPVSSFIQGVKKEVEKDDKETKEEADKRKEKNI
jgi:hypothetical protein